MLIAKTALPAFEDDLTPVISGHISDNFTCNSLFNDGAFRNRKNQIFPVFPVTAALSAGLSVAGRVFSLMSVVSKSIQTLIHFKNQIPAAAAVLTSQVDCINNFTDNLVVDNLPIVLETAKSNKIPVYGSEIEQVNKGCLASESLDYVALGKETGLLAARVLAGENAADTAVVLVKDSFPVYNADVAESLGLSIPDAYAEAQKVTTTA